MNISNPDKDLIQRFIDGELSPGEATAFKEKYSTDEQFHHKANVGIKAHLALRTVSRMNNYAMASGNVMLPDLHHDKPAPVRMLFRKNFLLRAAAVLIPLMVVASLVIFKLNTGNSTQDLYNEYFEEVRFKYKSIMNGSTLSDVELKEILASDPTTLESNPAQLESLVNKGILNMKENNFGNAINLFRLVAATKNSVYSQEAEWNLALCYIRVDEKSKALLLLDRITQNSGHKHFSDATNLKKKLKRPW